jgi:hypothetical protein
MIELFQRQIVKCRTPNEINRLHIALENRITPLEFVALSKIISDRYSSTQNVAWLEKLSRQLNLSHKPQPERYIRTRIKSNMCLYSDQTPRSDKVLAICFSGGARRLQMPIPTFLQHLSASRVDVILLQRHHNWNYNNGLGGLADSFETLINVIGQVIKSWNYKSAVTYGTSGGGLPALVTAIYLGLDKGVAIGAASVESDRWRFLKETVRFQQAVERYDGKPKLVSVFGADFERDARAAADLRRYFPTEFWAIPGEARHGAIQKYLRSGELGSFLSTVLFGQ